MAKFKIVAPDKLIKRLESIHENTEDIFGEMTRAGAMIAYADAKARLRMAFKKPEPIIKKMKITRTYRTPSDGGINNKVAVYGYINEHKTYKRRNTYKGNIFGVYESQGIPTPLVVVQREYGNSRGEKKIPIFRPAFQSSKIKPAMLKVQSKYIKD